MGNLKEVQKEYRPSIRPPTQLSHFPFLRSWTTKTFPTRSMSLAETQAELAAELGLPKQNSTGPDWNALIQNRQLPGQEDQGIRRRKTG